MDEQTGDRGGHPEADLDGDDPWTGLGARRGPRQPAEGVRIIGADEAAAAIESGHVAPKKPEDELRFGDVPPQPAGPRPSLRFPGADPAAVSKPPVAGEPIPPREDKQSAAAEAARRWDEALARSTAGRPSARPTSLFSDRSESDRDRDPSGYGRSSRMATEAPPPASGPPTGPPDYDPYEPLGAPTGPPDYDPLPDAPAFGANWLDEDPDLLAPTGGPAYDPAKYESPTGPPAYDPADYETPSMQHWTEPPSGEVPKILIDDEDEVDVTGEEDLSAWGSLSARPRWRDQAADWEDADFSEAILADEGHRVGALRAKRDDSSPFSFDEPEPEAPTPPAPPTGFDRSGLNVPGAAGPGGGRARISTLPTGGPPIPPGGNHGKDSRDVGTRVVVGGIAGGVLLVAAAIGPKALVVLIAIALTMATAEFFQAARTRGYHPATLLGLVGTPALVGAVYWRGIDAYPLVLALFTVFTLLWYLTGVVRAKPTMNIAVTILGFLYVGFLGSFAVLILAWPKGLILVNPKDVVGILLGAIIATVVLDIGSYFAGRSMGKTPLAPAISPNKTVEGLVGGALATVVVCLAVVGRISPWDGGKAFWLAVVVSVAAPLGDLCESMIKRDLGVKDMGAVLPGHGGVFDRIDALLFVAPAVYALSRLLFP